MTNEDRARIIVDFCLVEEKYKESAKKFVEMQLNEACLRTDKARTFEERMALLAPRTLAFHMMQTV